MKLIIYFNGDPSVGIFPTEYEVECPFEAQDFNSEEELIWFKNQIMDLYKEFDCNYAMYDFEYKQQADEYMKNFDNNEN